MQKIAKMAEKLSNWSEGWSSLDLSQRLQRFHHAREVALEQGRQVILSKSLEVSPNPASNPVGAANFETSRKFSAISIEETPDASINPVGAANFASAERQKSEEAVNSEGKYWDRIADLAAGSHPFALYELETHLKDLEHPYPEDPRY